MRSPTRPGSWPFTRRTSGSWASIPRGAGFQDDLRREYDDSMATLRLLLARIEKTDRLIDEIGYKLYGLTDEEIGIGEQAVG